MTDLTNQYTKEQIEEWASKRADDAGRLSRQLLATMQREAKLRKALLDIAAESLGGKRTDQGDIDAFERCVTTARSVLSSEYPAEKE